jgi:superfamily II DNA or RNA helicase
VTHGQTACASIKISFEAGTIVLTGDGASLESLSDLPQLVFDDRIGALRGPASSYRDVFAALYRRSQSEGFALEDDARAYTELDLEMSAYREPFPHQAEALAAWCAAGNRGLVVLPTGSGKSYVAELAIWKTGRSSLVVAPTIDLMNQWYDLLCATFDQPVGILGGGYHEVEELTVSTYDSAYLHVERLGNRFALVVFDECHHLPSPSYAQIAEMSIAPFRLGLTATPERSDGRHRELERLVGPEVYQRGIKELAGSYLAEYETVSVPVPLSPEDAEAYHRERDIYRGFVRDQGIRMSSPTGWGEFVMRSSMSRAGRRAFRAHREQRRIALAHEGKLHMLERLLRRHARDRVLIFTNDNETVYTISTRLLIPAITHQTPTKERKRYLEGFNTGDFPCLVTSKVLNEGVNIPEANVAIILSGSGTVREHVQRLGRILRRSGDKRATLYELITSQTVEEQLSHRRREHDAYR